MKALCLDSSGTTTLDQGRDYYVFPGGPGAYYVSKVERQTAHMGCYQADRFEVVEDQVDITKSKAPPTIEEDYEQLSLFGEPEFKSFKKEIIPKNVLCPLECDKSPRSKAFKEVQRVWKAYVNAVEKSHNCSFFEARKLVFKHRDNQEPIELGELEGI
ncbi:hypothetical protein [Halobacillus naozhouensis]|uniref:Uncharacterized protein n=1 Tax=Halobacillus naozhouensis TaxID=554880 RepID=A0ABY8J140_9BACI|nr:hypothetical protein [Halobacillus naozhouensis]WFT76218.1 hypothetical protein P9989_07605 [Halobacillus naozhouensis]